MNQTMFATTMDVTPVVTPVVTIGANFTGANYLDFGANPPDTDGAVGPSQFVELLNSAYRVYDKSGNVLQTSSLNEFWSSAGLPQASAFDPRILYDPDSQRWYAAALDFSGAFLLAVSNTTDPTQGWQAFDFDFGLPLDFTVLGVNREGIYLGALRFDLLVPEYAVIPKSDLLATPPTVANVSFFASSPDVRFTQPAVAPDVSGSEVILGLGPDFLKIDSIDWLPTGPVLNITDRIISIPEFPNTHGATQKDSTIPIVSNQLGIPVFSSSVVMQGDRLFGVETIAPTADQGHSALRWFEIGNPLTAPVVLDSGIISPPGLDVYYGSIAVNPLGEAVIGFSGSGLNDYPSAYAVAGTLNGDDLQFGELMLLKAGVAPADQNNGRFGDYSATTYDPTDPSHFWTIQEWISPSYWSTQITEIIFAPGIGALPVVTADRNHAPTPHGTVAADSAHGVLANDTDPVPGNSLSVSAINGLSDNVGHSVAGEFGTLTLNADGSYSYVDTAKPRDLPHKGVGEDVFTYTASDGHGGTSDSTLTIVVTRPNQEYTLGTPGQTLTNGNGPAVLDGALGDQTLIAGNSRVVLIGGPNDTLIAGHSRDTFVFGPTNFGANTIENFDVRKDTIQIDDTLFANFAAVQSHAAQIGADTVITYDAANTITMEGIALSNLHANDFLFV